MNTLQRGRMAVIALGLLCAQPCRAEAPKAAERVAYADLDLTSPRDAQTLLHRIRRAATAACERHRANIGQDFESIERFEACHREAVQRAVDQVGAAELAAALHPTARLSLAARR